MKNKEIEELLNAMKDKECYYVGTNGCLYQDLTKEEINLLLSYIEQLENEIVEYQKELEKADSITQSCIFNGKKDSEISYRKCLNLLEKYKENIEQLEKEYNRSLDKLRNLRVENEQLENNRDKAIEYIEKHPCNTWYTVIKPNEDFREVKVIKHQEILLNILKGGSDE